MTARANTLGRFVRSSRENLHLTQDELARRVGVSRSEISEIEAGRIKQPRATVFARLCDALGLPGAVLLATAGYSVGDALGYFEADELFLVARSLIELAGTDREWLRERLGELRNLLLARRSTQRAKSKPRHAARAAPRRAEGSS